MNQTITRYLLIQGREDEHTIGRKWVFLGPNYVVIAYLGSTKCTQVIMEFNTNLLNRQKKCDNGQKQN